MPRFRPEGNTAEIERVVVPEAMDDRSTCAFACAENEFGPEQDQMLESERLMWDLDHQVGQAKDFADKVLPLFDEADTRAGGRKLQAALQYGLTNNPDFSAFAKGNGLVASELHTGNVDRDDKSLEKLEVVGREYARQSLEIAKKVAHPEFRTFIMPKEDVLESLVYGGTPEEPGNGTVGERVAATNESFHAYEKFDGEVRLHKADSELVTWAQNTPHLSDITLVKKYDDLDTLPVDWQLGIWEGLKEEKAADDQAYKTLDSAYGEWLEEKCRQQLRKIQGFKPSDKLAAIEGLKGKYEKEWYKHQAMEQRLEAIAEKKEKTRERREERKTQRAKRSAEGDAKEKEYAAGITISDDGKLALDLAKPRKFKRLQPIKGQRVQTYDHGDTKAVAFRIDYKKKGTLAREAVDIAGEAAAGTIDVAKLSALFTGDKWEALAEVAREKCNIADDVWKGMSDEAKKTCVAGVLCAGLALTAATMPGSSAEHGAHDAFKGRTPVTSVQGNHAEKALSPRAKVEALTSPQDLLKLKMDSANSIESTQLANTMALYPTEHAKRMKLNLDKPVTSEHIKNQLIKNAQRYAQSVPGLVSSSEFAPPSTGHTDAKTVKHIDDFVHDYVLGRLAQASHASLTPKDIAAAADYAYQVNLAARHPALASQFVKSSPAHPNGLSGESGKKLPDELNGLFQGSSAYTAAQKEAITTLLAHAIVATRPKAEGSRELLAMSELAVAIETNTSTAQVPTNAEATAAAQQADAKVASVPGPTTYAGHKRSSHESGNGNPERHHTGDTYNGHFLAPGHTPQDKVYNFFIKEMGMSPKAAAGAVGSFAIESAGFTVIDGYGGGDVTSAHPGGDYYGLGQWDPVTRLPALENYAKNHGLDYRRLSTQLEFVKYELTTTHTTALTYLHSNGGSAASKAAIWGRYFEGAVNADGSLQMGTERQQWAAGYYHKQMARATEFHNKIQHAHARAIAEEQTKAANAAGPAKHASSGESNHSLSNNFAGKVAVAHEQAHNHEIQGATDLGVHDTYVAGNLVQQHLYAIDGFHSTSEESKPGDAYYVPGSNGNVIVSADIAQQVANLFKAAAADGITLSAASSFRSMPHQIILANGNLDRNAVAAAGYSKHQSGKAIDFDLNGLLLSASSFGTANGWLPPSLINPRVAPTSAVYRWMSANASKFGLHQFWNEPWHWSNTGN